MMSLCFRSLLLAGIAVLIWNNNAQAQVIEEIRCTDGSCLTSGYERFDDNDSLLEIGICNNSDCNSSGWQILRVSGQVANVICTNNSCYGVGFTEFDSSNNAIISMRSCNAGDCIANGWVDHTFIPEEVIEGIHCNAQGCDYGFLIEEIEQIIDSNNKQRERLERRIAKIEGILENRRARLTELQQKVAELENCPDCKKFNKKVHPRSCKNKSKKLASLKKRIARIEYSIQKREQHLAILQEKLEAIEDPVMVVDSRIAICLGEGECFKMGYTIYQN